MTDSDLLDVLRDCYAPMLRYNIVEQGLVQSATLTLDTEAPGANVRGVAPRFIAQILLYSPSSDDARNLQLYAQIQNRLAGISWISRSEIKMLPELLPTPPRKQA